jgi:hypothetical protein
VTATISPREASPLEGSVAEILFAVKVESGRRRSTDVLSGHPLSFSRGI